jgi:hypothetical protein
MSGKIYVTGTSKERERVRAAMAAVKKLGLEITHDWLAEIEQDGVAGAVNEALDDEKRRRYSRADLDAVRRADWFWLLAPRESPSSGCWVELGYALALADRSVENRDRHWKPWPRIIVSGPGRMKSIFASFAEEEFDDDVLALGYLAQGKSG